MFFSQSDPQKSGLFFSLSYPQNYAALKVFSEMGGRRREKILLLLIMLFYWEDY